MKIGFIGMGNMAKALVAGFLKSGKVTGDEIFAYAPHQDKLNKNASELGFTASKSSEELVEMVDIVIMACKPNQIEAVLEKLGDKLNGKALLSIAAGWNFASFTKILGDKVRIQCIMPNTPAMVGEGVMLFEKTNSLNDQEREWILFLFATLGIVEELPTSLMGIGGAVTGCGPAFMDLIMEGYADAAVKYGIPRSVAYKLVSQTMLGSAKLQRMTGEHPGVLKDAVCSPGGTTIRGVDALEHGRLRAICIDSIDAIMNKK